MAMAAWEQLPLGTLDKVGDCSNRGPPEPYRDMYKSKSLYLERSNCKVGYFERL